MTQIIILLLETHYYWLGKKKNNKERKKEINAICNVNEKCRQSDNPKNKASQ